MQRTVLWSKEINYHRCISLSASMISFAIKNISGIFKTVDFQIISSFQVIIDENSTAKEVITDVSIKRQDIKKTIGLFLYTC